MKREKKWRKRKETGRKEEEDEEKKGEEKKKKNKKNKRGTEKEKVVKRWSQPLSCYLWFIYPLSNKNSPPPWAGKVAHTLNIQLAKGFIKHIKQSSTI